MLKWFCTLWLLISPVYGANTETVFAHPTTGAALLKTVLATPSRALADAQVIQGQFTHRKYLSELPQPLTANGDFIFGRDLGVYWHTRQPFDSVFVLTRNGLVQRDEGAEALRIGANEQPAVRLIASIFLALFTLDVNALSNNFDLYSEARGATWSIGLKPKSTAIASVFTHAVITGATDVEQVVLMDKHGDRTVIDLKDIAYSAAAPSSAVRALFKQ